METEAQKNPDVCIDFAVDDQIPLPRRSTDLTMS